MAYAILSASSCPNNNPLAYYMYRLPVYDINEMSDKYWTCNSMGHIHPFLGNKVIYDDNTFADRAGACPVDLFTRLNDEKLSETATSSLNWSCYMEENWSRGHLNNYEALSCTRCDASLKSDAYVRLIKEWTDFANDLAPHRDIKDKGENLVIMEIAVW